MINSYEKKLRGKIRSARKAKEKQDQLNHFVKTGEVIYDNRRRDPIRR